MPTTIHERRQQLRNLLAQSACVQPASVFDPMSARCAAEIGFEMMMMAGSTAALEVLGAPDLVLITLSEFAEQARRITRAVDLPLLVDADHGYGNALNAMRTVEELEFAGVAALTLEDTALPVPFGSAGKPSLISIQEGTAKIRAALAARTDPLMVIAARTSAVRITGLDDAIERVKAYEAAGADAIFLSGVQSSDELDAVSSATRLPLMLGNVPKAMDDLDYLASRNVRIALQGHKPMLAAIGATYATMRQLREGVHPSAIEGPLTPKDLDRLSREPEFEQLRASYLSLTHTQG